MSTVASQITGVSIVYSTFFSRRKSKKISNLHVTGLFEGNSPVTGEFPEHRASNAENDIIYDVIMQRWHHWICHYLFWISNSISYKQRCSRVYKMIGFLFFITQWQARNRKPDSYSILYLLTEKTVTICQSPFSPTYCRLNGIWPSKSNHFHFLCYIIIYPYSDLTSRRWS